MVWVGWRIIRFQAPSRGQGQLQAPSSLASNIARDGTPRVSLGSLSQCLTPLTGSNFISSFGSFHYFLHAGLAGLLLVGRAPGVHLLAELPQEELHAAVRRCFAVVNSSTSEGMSAAILEVIPSSCWGYSVRLQRIWNHLLLLEMCVNIWCPYFKAREDKTKMFLFASNSN